MDSEWMKNPNLAGIDPAKLMMLQSLARDVYKRQVLA